ncbi:MAG TPA: NAD(P)H-hydrate dehydratase, partial [Lacipirellulaceae bacterium]
SRGMAGAIALAGKATLRSGAGLVTVAVPTCVLDVVAGFEPSYMTHPLADNGEHLDPSTTTEIIALAKTATAVAVGPGLGRSAALTDLVQHMYHQIDRPMVVDADALFSLAARPQALALPGGERILTPHPGEFARFTGQRVEMERRAEAAAALAKRDAAKQTIVVLKGHCTIVSDGAQVSINQTGNPGMATGGSGDVLTGVITGLLCQGLSPFDAARLGVHVHGLAGDLAAEELGQVSLIASDLIEYLPKALLRLKS